MSRKTLELIEQIAREVRVCSKCELHKGRNKAVPGDGNASAKMMFIGEAPGKEEDIQGKPFVGAAGKLLTKVLFSIGLAREDIFITNIVKCRPPENRPPRVPEIGACSDYLERQISVINPKLLCPMGSVALRVLMGKDASISSVHGRFISGMKGRTIFPLYHPAAVLYAAKLRSLLEEDFSKLGKEID